MLGFDFKHFFDRIGVRVYLSDIFVRKQIFLAGQLVVKYQRALAVYCHKVDYTLNKRTVEIDDEALLAVDFAAEITYQAGNVFVRGFYLRNRNFGRTCF